MRKLEEVFSETKELYSRAFRDAAATGTIQLISSSCDMQNSGRYLCGGNFL